eukprot:3672119-Rhodomonas_salina.3
MRRPRQSRFPTAKGCSASSRRFFCAAPSAQRSGMNLSASSIHDSLKVTYAGMHTSEPAGMT